MLSCLRWSKIKIVENCLRVVEYTLGVDPYPHPTGHFEAPWWPFWILQVVWCCKQCSAAGSERRLPPDTASLVFKQHLWHRHCFYDVLSDSDHDDVHGNGDDDDVPGKGDHDDVLGEGHREYLCFLFAVNDKSI